MNTANQDLEPSMIGDGNGEKGKLLKLMDLTFDSAIAPEEKVAIRSRLLTALDEEQKPV